MIKEEAVSMARIDAILLAAKKLTRRYRVLTASRRRVGRGRRV